MVGKVACEPCLDSLFAPQRPRCLWCGEALPCKAHQTTPARLHAGAVYEGPIKDLILMLKYRRYETLGSQLGRALAKALPRPEADLLIPVPLHLRSRRRYNHAGLIARGLAQTWGLETREAARWTVHVESHAGMNAAQRRSLSREAFAFGEDLSGLRVAFVDDVSTTGATLSRLAQAARSRGARVVGGFVLAQPFFVQA
jgi:predicted amidophosphoribosyltransferase